MFCAERRQRDGEAQVGQGYDLVDATSLGDITFRGKQADHEQRQNGGGHRRRPWRIQRTLRAELAALVDVGVVPGARIELATPAFSGRRSTNELPWHCTNSREAHTVCQIIAARKFAANLRRRNCALGASVKNRGAYSCADWSNSRIQLRFFNTSRGLVPSGGPTMPSFSIRSIKRAARP